MSFTSLSSGVERNKNKTGVLGKEIVSKGMTEARTERMPYVKTLVGRGTRERLTRRGRMDI